MAKSQTEASLARTLRASPEQMPQWQGKDWRRPERMRSPKDSKRFQMENHGHKSVLKAERMRVEQRGISCACRRRVWGQRSDKRNKKPPSLQPPSLQRCKQTVSGVSLLNHALLYCHGKDFCVPKIVTILHPFLARPSQYPHTDAFARLLTFVG